MWREAKAFTETGRAALALTEQATRIAGSAGVDDDDTWETARKQFGDEELAALMAVIAVINAFDRFNVIARAPAGDYQFGTYGYVRKSSQQRGGRVGGSHSLGLVPTVLPDLDVEKLRRFCTKRVPKTLADEVRLEVTTRGKSISIHERRPLWRGPTGEWTSMPIAQLRYEGDGAWTLYFGDRHGKWVVYPALEPRQRVDAIINELEEDPTCIFWG